MCMHLIEVPIVNIFSTISQNITLQDHLTYFRLQQYELLTRGFSQSGTVLK